MKRYLYFCLFIIVFLPVIVFADTWLDKEAYRDVSWYDETISEYTIDTPQKMAGLLYLVNVQGYTFENKHFKLVADTNKSICVSNENCLLDMSAHEWVPLKNYYKGGFNRYQCEGTADCRVKNVRLYIETTNDKIKFIENERSDHFSCYEYRSSTYNLTFCNDIFIGGYDFVIDANNGGNVEYLGDGDKGVVGDYVKFRITPSENYYIKTVEVKDYQGNDIEIYDIDAAIIPHVFFHASPLSNEFYDYNAREIKFSMPDSIAKIKVVFRERGSNKCRVISGIGNKIGDEIACGSEHFYITAINNDKIKMISKYNLYTGNVISKVKIEKNDGDNRSDEQYCEALAYSNGGVSRREGYYNVPGYCFIALPISYNLLRQNEEAISAHWDNDGNYLYPQVGDVYLKSGQDTIITPVHSDFYIDLSSAIKYDGYFYDLNLGDSYNGENIIDILESYRHTLDIFGIDVDDINLITLDEINDIIKENNKFIPYQQWYNSTGGIQQPRYEFAFLNEYLTSSQNFVYSTTYWIRTGYDRVDNHFGVNSVVFVDSYGGVCGAGIDMTQHQNCGVLLSDYNTKIGCGIRPVITIPNDLEYVITVETDGNGMVEVADTAAGDEAITFSISSNRGYKLKRLVVTTNSGEVVSVDAGDIILNDDGTVSVDNNTFTMPFENVTIEAKWEEDIPKNEETNVVDESSENGNNSEIDDDLKKEIENIINNPQVEEPEAKTDNPKTKDRIVNSIIVFIISCLGLGFCLHVKKESR